MIKVTSPLLPPLKEFIPYLEKIWESKWITNNGSFHKELESALCEYLKVPFISLFTNGTLSLVAALHALKIKGEVITTPFSFVATSHALLWNGITPVFVDIDARNGNMDPDKIEAAITPDTQAILPVHVYGMPCATERIQQIADKHNLKVIYDAAHAFGVEQNGRSVLTAGDMSTLSFHATKAYNTIEGGALICHDAETKQYVDHLKNFGFVNETTVIEPGINCKMDEIRSAYGLLNLKYVDAAIASRQKTARCYRDRLTHTQGITLFEELRSIRYTYAYFPILVDENRYGITRDELYFKMREQGIFGRRYFYPLISDFPMYRHLPSASADHLPVANKIADSVICLPMHHQISEYDVRKITDLINNLK